MLPQPTFSNTVGFTEEILEILTQEELDAVARHELAHLRESWGQKAVRALAPVQLTLLVLAAPAGRQFGVLGFYALLGLWFLAARQLGKFSRRMEQSADAAGGAEDSDAAMASALEKLYVCNLVPAVVTTKHSRTHPNLVDRMRACGHPPAWPDPTPPPATARRMLILEMLAAVICAVMLIPAKAKGKARTKSMRASGAAAAAASVISSRPGTPDQPYSNSLWRTNSKGLP